VDAGESCDDGGREPGDGCDDQCRSEACGNGRVDALEGCDDGALEPGDGCDGRCRIEACGNGRLDLGEVCDDGGRVPGDGCDANCASERFGNGLLAIVPGEACDDGVERDDAAGPRGDIGGGQPDTGGDEVPEAGPSPTRRDASGPAGDEGRADGALSLGDGASDDVERGDAGCGCSAGGDRAPLTPLLFVALAALLRRRRPRRLPAMCAR